MNNAQPTLSSAAASTHGAASPSLELCEARRARNGLATLLRAEQFAMADFLIALAEFDRRRGWEALGHSSLFAFLHVDLKLPNPSAYWRKSAAQALHRFPDLIEPLRDGRLCCSSTAELAKVLTEENKEAVLPRFFGLSSREAQEVVAELQPRQAPATRTVVTRVTCQPVAQSTVLDQPQPTLGLTPGHELLSAPAPELVPASAPGPGFLPLTLTPAPDQHPYKAPLSQLRTPEVDFGGDARTVARRDEIEPLSAERRRVHVNVSREFVKKLKTARAGLSHSIRGATMEQVLEAALDLLLEKQARARGLVKKPRTRLPDAAPTATATATSIATSTLAAPTHPEHRAEERSDRPGPSEAGPREASPPLALLPTEPPPAGRHTAEPRPPRREGPREAIPAAVRRAVWERDGGRCAWPLDAGGRCGSTHRLEIDHVIPWSEWGPSTVGNLRVVCGRHNALAARRAFGERWMGRYSAPGEAPGRVRAPRTRRERPWSRALAGNQDPADDSRS